MTDRGTTLDIIEPYYDEEARGVLFEVAVEGHRVQAYVSCVLLGGLVGRAVDGDAAVAAYRRHQREIDAVVALRAPAEAWETVILRPSDLP